MLTDSVLQITENEWLCLVTNPAHTCRWLYPSKLSGRLTLTALACLWAHHWMTHRQACPSSLAPCLDEQAKRCLMLSVPSRYSAARPHSRACASRTSRLTACRWRSQSCFMDAASQTWLPLRRWHQQAPKQVHPWSSCTLHAAPAHLQTSLESDNSIVCICFQPQARKRACMMHIS